MANKAGKLSLRTVVAASSAGTTFEWYDFFVFGALAQIISRTFFTGLSDTAGYVAALALFGAGFAVRPLGALVFGRIGDQAGRKGAFLITVILMGGATVAIGLLPTYSQAGVLAPILLVLMRIVQGFALGGEYGGAAIYVAEHSPPGRRATATAWVQSAASFGLVSALLVILVTRTIIGAIFGPEAFDAWGWRIPFLFSAGLLAISIWMRVKLSESPTFIKMKAAGGQSKAPYAETFGQWKNLRYVLIAFFSIMTAQGAVWYTTFFYSQTFLEKFLKVEPATINALMMLCAVASAFLYVVFGALADRIGRKPVMLGGILVMLVAYFPVFHLLSATLNPALAEAQARTPVVVVADPADCSLQFDPVGKSAFLSSCDIAKSTLANAGVSYENRPAPAGARARVMVGETPVDSVDARRMPAAEAQTAKMVIETQIKAALTTAGYPNKADPARMNFIGAFGAMMILVVAASALYGPMAACLVELFPARIRYTGMSLPYHAGTGWIGGFVPFTAFAIVAAVGNIYSGLWYPFWCTVLAALTTFFFLPETKDRSIEP